MIYDRIKVLCKKRGISVNMLEEELSISRGALCRIDINKPGGEKLQKLADYFGVSIEYILTGKTEEETSESTLTKKDERDIAKNLEKMMSDLKDNKDGPLYFNGEEIDDTSAELLAAAFDSALRQMKIINKVKYNPNKNKKK